VRTVTFDWGAVATALPDLAAGLATTLQLTVLVIALSMVLAVPLALARTSEHDGVRWAAMAYIEVFRCTPVLIQLFWVFYALPILTGVTLPGFLSAVIALTANLTAFMAEAYRTGIQAVPSDQIEAARMLQLTPFQRARHIVFPQAVRGQLPTILSLNISLFKETALVATIAVPDLMFVTNTHVAESYRSLEFLTVAAALYFMFAFPASLAVNWVERRTLTGGGVPGLDWKRVAAAMVPGARPRPAPSRAQAQEVRR
jgi:polar amino acid transport system permease protein